LKGFCHKYTSKILTISLLVGLVITSAFENEAGGIRFVQGNWGYASKLAREADKPMFVFVGAPYCQFSQKMEVSFETEDLGLYFNKYFTCKKLDTENPMHNFRASNMGVTSVPTLLFLDKEHHIVHKVTGYRSYDQIIKEAEFALKKIDEEKRRKVR